MSDLLAATGWIGEHPADGTDVAHLLLYPATDFDTLSGPKIQVLASVFEMVDATVGAPGRSTTVSLDATTRLAHLPGLVLAVEASVEWWAAAQAHGMVVVTLTRRPLSAPSLTDVDQLLTGPIRREDLWSAFAPVSRF